MDVKPRELARLRDDGDKQKAYPNGIQVTAHAIWQYWLNVTGQTEIRHTSLRDFQRISNITEVAKSVADRYPGLNQKPVSSSDMMPYRIGTRDRAALSYFQIRVLADYVELPTSLFMLFTHLVSEEKNAQVNCKDSNQEVRKLIECAERFITEARRQLDEHEETGDTSGSIFSVEYRDPDNHEALTWLAKMDSLKLLVDATDFDPNIRSTPDE